MEQSGRLHAPAALPLSEINLYTYWNGGCVGPRGGLDILEEIQISCSCRDLYNGLSSVQAYPSQY
jgi:hypothetical protein